MEQFFPSKLKNKLSDLPARSISSRSEKSVWELDSINNHPIANELIRVFKLSVNWTNMKVLKEGYKVAQLRRQI